MNPFRFGVQASTVPGVDGPRWAEIARRAEGHGYSTITVADHFDDQLAPVPALMAAADATTTLRVGALVLGNDYRHPVVVAKEAATIDRLSEGRFELGIGAGWMTTDYAGSGIALDSPGTRIERLGEAVDVIRALLAGGAVSYHGRFYDVDGLEGFPRPCQDRLPILLGGGGRRMLTLAGRAADIVAINVNLRGGALDATVGVDATPVATDRKIAWVRESAGDRFAALELHVRVHLAVVTPDRHAVAEAMAPAFGIEPHEALESPHALAGTVEQIADDLIARRERFGISYIGIGLDAMDALAPVVARLAAT